ncbi:energy transducer TonB [Hanstruepera ponticola]|uniref:hypothetical protein n=1 Tax=Hanstruepera ponticola TaxID=2042995 RepID=UPI0017823CBB|nr:hypothetical protein [Hanstruepera ponticola]
MKKLLLPVLFITSFFSFCQNHLVAEKPLFNGVSQDFPEKYKLQDLKFKTQDFISKNLDQAFIKKFLPVGDTIEFNIQYTINKEGLVNPEDIFVNTEVDFFNLKIKSVLVKLPKFKPATSIGPSKNINYTINFTPEFYVNQLHKLVPVYRYDFPNISLDIYDDETELFELAKSLGYDVKSKNKITNVVHFETDENLNVKNIRVFTENKLFSKKISPFLTNLNENDKTLHSQLKKNTNYVVFIHLFLRYKEVEIAEFPVFPKCEKYSKNDKRSKCFESKLSSFIYKKFDDRVLSNIHSSGVFQIRVFFKIDTTGSISEVKVIAPHPKLTDETKRIMNLLPKMIKPGYDKDGIPINVPFYIPIKFEIQKNSTPKFNPYKN